ncbi:MAG: adenylate kinase [Fimbriimonas ginsengisoli]|uniref:Adenylate kinase n=1 Tax=Fimbriimonas ginsengisoli TaxID=1005039 RepID=A0A931PT17_FIMGI|nr:adenylate kinase [Fimbriimonas ginsengisoli]
MRLILIGPPGVGKGTQATLLKERTGALPISSGDLFRAEMCAGTELGNLAKSYVERGQLVPDEVTIGMMRRRLAKPDVRERGFILDGFPRTLGQAEGLDHLLSELGLELGQAVLFEVPEDVVVARLGGRLTCPSCGEVFHRVNRPPKVDGVCDRCGSALAVRKDDQPETIRERMRVFREATAPLADYYERLGLLRRVNGSGAPEAVYQEIVRP